MSSLQQQLCSVARRRILVQRQRRVPRKYIEFLDWPEA